MDSELDAGHPEIMRERPMYIRSQLAYHLVALGNLPKSDRIATIRCRLRILNQPKRNNVSGVAGILYVSERLDYRIVRYLSCH
jgi:hypothetical protein